MKTYKYIVKLGNEIVNQGETTKKTEAIKAFKGFGRYSYGSIAEIYPDGSTSEIGYKKMGKSLYCW